MVDGLEVGSSGSLIVFDGGCYYDLFCYSLLLFGTKLKLLSKCYR